MEEADLAKIEAGLAIIGLKSKPDQNDELEKTTAERHAFAERLTLDNKLTESKIKDRRAERRMRNDYAKRILRYLEVYSGVVALIVIFRACRPERFFLPTEVLATLVGSTAVAAIGLVGFVARGLFRTSASRD